ncbi:hypothetical protein BJ944DRAFT_270836 [Cunninghamella echinulata]|nr:hypothetical protein BJ944DRAFT_270836 [Cunninghamella echinulata]
MKISLYKTVCFIFFVSFTQAQQCITKYEDIKDNGCYNMKLMKKGLSIDGDSVLIKDSPDVIQVSITNKRSLFNVIYMSIETLVKDQNGEFWISCIEEDGGKIVVKRHEYGCGQFEVQAYNNGFKLIDNYDRHVQALNKWLDMTTDNSHVANFCFIYKGSECFPY